MRDVLLVFVLIFCAIILVFLVRGMKTSQGRVRIAGHTEYQVDVATSLIAQAQGLSGRATMPEHTGMLFVFSQAAPRYFWMKDMNFALDFVWIRDGKVVGLNENIQPPSATKGKIDRINSNEPADQVLEINAGQIAKQGIKIGDTVSYEK